MGMKQLYIKQKVFSLSEKFTVNDEQERDIYYVTGSFMKVPKTFTITDKDGKEVALITKKIFSFLPKFFVEVNGQEVCTIKKELSFLNPDILLIQQGLKCAGTGGIWIFK